MSVKASEASVASHLYRRSYEHFVRAFWPVVAPGKALQWNWHMSVLCRELQTAFERVFRGQPKEYDLVVNVPPGSSKSTIFSIMAPAWAWTRMPTFSFLGASYGYALSLELSRKSRDVVKSELYRACFPEVKLREDADTKGHFINTSGGMRYATGMTGSTGFHFDVISIDDPLNPEEAGSEAERYNVNEFISGTLLQRKKDNEVTLTVTVMQRLHQSDPSAVRIKEGGVRHFCLPATTEGKVNPPELKSQYVDGLLDPVRLSHKTLEEKRKRGEHFFAGQYLQDPRPTGGGLFKTGKFNAGRPPERFKRLIRFWDKAATANPKDAIRGAYTAGVLMAEDWDDRYWVLDVARFRLDTFAREAKVKDVAVRDGRTRVEVGLEQEPGSGGKDQVKQAIKRLAGFRVRVLVARRDKTLRAEEFSIQVNAGNVWLPAKFYRDGMWTGWASEYVEELSHFPFSSTMDQTDACLVAGTLIDTSRGQVPIEDIREGDLVHTRYGLRRVNWSGMTGRVDSLTRCVFANGSELVGTGHHPVLTHGRGFARLDSLSGNDKFLVRCGGAVGWSSGVVTNMKSWCTEGLNTNEGCRAAGTSGRLSRESGTLYTEPSTENISETFLISTRFITRTKTHLTTNLPTWNVSQRRSIDLNTGNIPELLKCWHSSNELDHSLSNGTVHQTGKSFTVSSERSRGRAEQSTLAPANSVVRSSPLGARSNPPAALTAVTSCFTLPSGGCGSSVSFAGKSSSPLARKSVSAQNAVRQLTCTGSVEVYNLEVEGVPEFFANGILVHNSSGAFNFLAAPHRRAGALLGAEESASEEG